MFWSKNKKNGYTSVLLYKVGFKGVYVTRICSRDVFHAQLSEKVKVFFSAALEKLIGN